ncbi:hypothetical protein FHR99_002554 [Litorivivens lipolytica]|uniref:Uncharacterized protein n=1 Tax=Litorivivens lipolytica TaxID=1524264 RepID=A0A7W4W6E1_9GAMM|nr:hypothetical protein [Litorivivens lipolytica]MBB3048280.1 hypothetical protein [Litorivivens lipolytica]
MQRSTVKMFGLAVVVTALVGCNGDSDGFELQFVPTATNFSSFVKDLFGKDPTTATPTEINDVDFTFLDNTNPKAFDSQLQ